MAAVAGGLSAVADGVLVFRAVGGAAGHHGRAGRAARAAAGSRRPGPGADGGIIDAQSVRGADTVGRESRGYDAGKKVKGGKPFIVTDTLGLLLVVMVCAASVQDRDGGRPVLNQLTDDRRRVRPVFADGGFAGRLVDWAAEILRVTVEVVRKTDGQRGFSVLPRRWAVERTLAWITAHRRLVRDYERRPANSEAMIRWAMISTMVRRITRGHPATRPGRRPLEYLT